MGKISRIQLRGISRTPSDRIVSDGGCEESLNVYLDNAESAPAFKPEDVTKKLGLPNVLADYAFVHKTAQYEHIVLQEGADVVAYVKGQRQVIFNEERLKVNDITSVGNTLIITTDSNMYYVLYNERKYTVLGNKVYFPHINFEPSAVDGTYPVFLTKTTLGDAWFEKMPSEEGWNAKYNGKTSSRNDTVTKSINEMLKEFGPAVEAKRQELLEENGWLCGTVFIRYAVELYDGTKYSSMPILISPKSINPISTKITIEGSYRRDNQGVESTSSIRNEIRSELSFFAIEAKMDDVSEELLKWKDIIKSINLYISFSTIDTYSKDVSRLYNRSEVRQNLSDSSWQTTYTGDLFLGSKQNEEDVEKTLLRLSSQTYLMCEMDVDTSLNTSGIDGDATMGIQTTIADLINGTTLNLTKLKEIQTYELLNEDDMKHYTVFAKRLNTYNNRTILTQPSQVLAYDYNALNAYEKGPQDDENFTLDQWDQLEVTYLIKGVEGDFVVKSGPFIYKTEEYHEDAQQETVYPFQIFPDARAYKMIIKRSVYYDEIEDGVKYVRYGVFDMKPHPYLDCAYYFGGLDNSLPSLCTQADAPAYSINNVEEVGNKIYVSSFENPFYFPIEGRFTFQSEIIGIAVASAALSQGQFGRFTLYVFTGDGIWVTETDEEGKLQGIKAMRRDVCVNANSITSIDDAVVFVTNKGLMMVSGSQAVNLSPFMNGRHYTLDSDAKVIIQNHKDFSHLIPAMTDATPFMAFMKKASIAYDYSGQRLICIAPDEKYQYIYKLDTQTWHKVAHGIDFKAVLNSYPECFVQAVREETIVRTFWRVTEYGSQEELDYLAGKIRIVLPDLTDSEIREFLDQERAIEVTGLSEDDQEWLANEMDTYNVATVYEERKDGETITRIYDVSTILDAADPQPVEKGIIVTRPLNLGEPDVKKIVQDIRIRGTFERGKVQYILLGSDDGIRYYSTRLKQKSWKLFRIVIAANLAPTERISWIDVMFDTRYTTRLR